MGAIDSKFDLVVSFDTTGSMYPVISQVRREVEQFIKTMFSEFSDLRLGIIAHGDYCDAGNPYTILALDLTRDEERLCDFVRTVDRTYGGDADECYELVLKTARTDFSWRDDSNKIFIMIGDAAPHSVTYRDNKEKLDWLEQTELLNKEGVKVFAVHALSYYRTSSKMFYKTVAEKTFGTYLTLDQFSEVVDLIKATVYQQSGEEKLNEFVTIIKDSGKMTHSMDRNIRRLKGESVSDEEDSYGYGYESHRKHRTKSSGTEAGAIKEMAELEPVRPGRFQVMSVEEDCDIRKFVTDNGIEFCKGRGFYELTKVETVQQYKEVIMQDRETGEMFIGTQVREKLGLQPQTEKGGVNEKLYAKDAKEFRIFVQSTSVNRKLIGGTTFLYEVNDFEDTGTEIKVESTDVKVEKPVEEVKTEKKAEKKTSTKKKAKKSVKKVASKIVDKTEETPVEHKEVVATDETTKETVTTKDDSADKKAVLQQFVDELAATEAKLAEIKSKKSEEKAKEATKAVDKPKKARVKKSEPKFTEFTGTGLAVPVADKEKKKTVVKETKTEKKLKNISDAQMSQLGSVVKSVNEAAEKFNKSNNKKNTASLESRLKNTIKIAQKMLDSIQ
jgi:hypothetical protein